MVCNCTRELGEEVLKKFDAYYSKIQFPMIEPTLLWIAREKQCSVADIKIYLFASNQVPTLTREDDYKKDTYSVAEVAEQYFKKKYNIPKSNKIEIKSIEGNPADYENMLAFYHQELPKIAKIHGIDSAHYYAEVSGGTPAMTSMLIVMGVETFGQAMDTLYIERGADAPYRLGIDDVLFARKVRQSVTGQIGLYAYKAAYQTVDENLQSFPKPELLKSVLTYADRRLAFDYKAAKSALADVQATGNLQVLIT